MNFRSIIVVAFLCGPVVVATAGKKPAAPNGDTALAAARKLVERSDRYMHHSELRRDMEGYGLTVLAGTKVVRFDVKIISVMTKWGPHQDVILAKLSGQGLEKTGVISGMSGSPVYVRDADGKDKLIGAVAYGWSAQKVPLCGIQPITQMLTTITAAARSENARKDTGSAAGGAAGPAAMGGEVFLAALLAPEKRRFARFGWPARLLRQAPKAVASSTLAPLTTPLMVRGMGTKTMDEIRKLLGPTGLMAVKAGGVDAARVKADAKLRPGSAIAVPLVTGDADFSAVGTVTDVVKGRVLAFGHSFFGEGAASYPMGPAYVHVVVPGLFRSFKLTSALGVTGTLERDEYVGVAGRIGPKPQMVPMTVNVDWKNDRRRQTYRYKMCRHRRLTPMLASFMIFDAAWGWRDLPAYHNVRYSMVIDFGKLGKYTAGNVSSGYDVFWVLSDMERPIAALLNNPYGKPPEIKEITVDMTIDTGDISARVIDFKLDGRTYRPGETLTGKVTLRRFRKPRTTAPVKFKLPADLPEGSYSLQVCSWYDALSRLESEMPHRFDPRTPAQLLKAISRTVQPQANVLYLRLAVKKGSGLAVRKRELPDLPESRARIMAEADSLDTNAFSRAIVRKVATDYVLSGSASAKFEVAKRPAETLIRKQGS